MRTHNAQDQRLATADETTPAGGIASPLHPLVRCFMFGWFKKKKPQPSRIVQCPTPHDDGMATSIALGYALNDGILGGVIGGNIVGGIIGDAMNTSENDGAMPEASDSGCHQSDSGYDSSADSGSSYDSGSSGYDSGSYDSGSYDSGCSGGFD